MDMIEDEKQIADWLAKNNLIAKKFTKEEKRKSMTPDFRVFKDDGFAFYCEVKTVASDTWLDDQLELAPPRNIVDGYRSDPTYNRLTDDIHKAVKQFDAVNPNAEFLNVLAFVNHDDSCEFKDLRGVITGNLITDDGSRHPIYGMYSDGRIKEEKNRIHLYYWKDDFNSECLFFNMSDRKRLERLCGYFDRNPNDIKVL